MEIPPVLVLDHTPLSCPMALFDIQPTHDAGGVAKKSSASRKPRKPTIRFQHAGCPNCSASLKIPIIPKPKRKALDRLLVLAEKHPDVEYILEKKPITFMAERLVKKPKSDVVAPLTPVHGSDDETDELSLA